MHPYLPKAGIYTCRMLCTLICRFLCSVIFWLQLKGYPLPYGALILPKPCRENTSFLILHQRVTNYYGLVTDLLQSTVDITLNNGLGDVTEKNETIIKDTLGNGFSAVRHANGRDWWVIVPEANSSCYYITNINPELPIITKECVDTVINIFGVNCLFTADGNHFIHLTSRQLNTKVKCLKFDRSNGILSDCKTFTIRREVQWYGFAISPNSRYFYTSIGDSLLQYDLFSTDIESSEVVVSKMNIAEYNGYGYLQLAPDGKIYVGAGTHVSTLHIINFPDNPGLSCNVEKSGINKFGTTAEMPFFPNFRLGAAVGINELNSNQNFEIKASPNPTSDVTVQGVDS